MRTIRTIGGLRAELAPLRSDALVFVDNRPPSALSSWRGVYADLAIECAEADYETTRLVPGGASFDSDMFGTYSPGSPEVQIKQPPTVADLIEALDLADGATFEGYKGGQFPMVADSDLWVSEYGRAQSVRIAAIEDLGGRVDLVTIEVDW